MNTATLIIAIVLSQTPRLDTYHAQAERQRKADITATEKQIVETRKEWIKARKDLAGKTRPGVRNGATEAKRRLDELQTHLVEIKDGDYVPDIKEFSIGSIGKFRIEVTQVISPSELIGRAWSEDARSTTIWIRGVSTEGVTDERNNVMRVTKPYEVTGTKTYTNALGATRTVFVVEPLKLPKGEARGGDNP